MIYIHEVLESGEVATSTRFIEGVPAAPFKGGVIVKAEQEYLPGRYYYDGESFQSIPQSPSSNYKFNYLTRRWEDPRTLQQLKDLKWEEIKSFRDQEEFGPFVYNGMAFDGDVDAQRRLLGYISVSKTALANGEMYSQEFILADNTVVTLQANDFVAIELAKVDQVAAAFAKAVLLRQQIEQASSKEELEAIAWNS